MNKWWKGLTLSLVIPGFVFLNACSSSNSTVPTASKEVKKETTNEVKERTIKAGLGIPEDHPEAQGLKKFKELLEQKSGGKLKVEPYYAAQLGDDLKMIQALQAGTQEITIPSTSPLVGMVKEYGIFDFPFQFQNEKEADAVLDGPLGQSLLEKLPAQKLVGLAYWENGYRYLTNSTRPVAKAEDFKGLKIRTMQNNIHLEAFKALGVNPTPMPFSEVFTSLESKAIDGQENPLSTIKASKLYEVQKYLSLSKHVYSPFVFLVGKSFWDKLSPEEQKMMKEAAIEAGKYQRQINRDSNQKALDDLKAAGMTVSEISPEEMTKMKEIMKPVTDKFAKEIGEDLVKQMNEEIEKARKK